ncbi:hypothetical protein DQ237_03760 [Blastococcus sp. TF02-8]|uniref:hypothetical protein n=1 Tax=Blastococcus sp. TF02-8 TaxID=2250574 RepID=UPI000DEAE6E9|nr:hypothetical protein [Blastococcus sp. TF02-8]RBY98020.1 hypothetical protein DQ237_03760 [Blastococcus sp. TF02-8]
MTYAPHRLVLLPGDVPAAVTRAEPVRLEVAEGILRRISADGTESWDVTGCRLRPTRGDSLGATAPFAFVTTSGEIRCWLDLAEWMPGVLCSDPTTPPAGLGRWTERVAQAVAEAAGVARESRSVPTGGARVYAAEAALSSRRSYVQLAAVLAAVVLTGLG